MREPTLGSDWIARRFLIRSKGAGKCATNPPQQLRVRVSHCFDQENTKKIASSAVTKIKKITADQGVQVWS